MKTEKNCKKCGKSFVSYKSLFCSGSCRMLHRYYENGRNGKDARILLCECGEKLHHATQKRCENCQRIYWNIRHRGRKKSQGEVSKQVHKRRARESNSICDLTETEWENTVKHFDYQCVYCGSKDKDLHRDHFIPLTKGGGYTKKNIVPTCASCNSSKNNKNPLDWLVKKVHGILTYARITSYLESL